MILVVGATGVVGGMISRGLLEEGKEVRVLVRRDSTFLATGPPGPRHLGRVADRSGGAAGARGFARPRLTRCRPKGHRYGDLNGQLRHAGR